MIKVELQSTISLRGPTPEHTGKEIGIATKLVTLPFLPWREMEIDGLQMYRANWNSKRSVLELRGCRYQVDEVSRATTIAQLKRDGWEVVEA